MVSASDLGPEGREFEPRPVHHVVFLGKTLDSYSASLHPDV